MVRFTVVDWAGWVVELVQTSVLRFLCACSLSLPLLLPSFPSHPPTPTLEHYREHYLGHSLKAPVGRWQKGKDLMWYTKAGKGGGGEGGREDPEAQRQRELAEIRRRDEDMINAALGLAPTRQAVVETTLDASEMKQLLARGASERGEMDAERVEGLGAAPAARHEHLPKGKSMVQREIERMKNAQTEGRAFEYEEDLSHMHEEEGEEGGQEGGKAGGKRKRRRKGEGEKEVSKKEKKKIGKKEEKKRKKAEKKERKKEKKVKRKEEEEEEEGGREGGRSRGRSEKERGRSTSRSSSSDSPEDRKRRRRTGSAHEEEEEGRREGGGSRGGRSEKRERNRSGSRSSRSESPDDSKRRRRTGSASRSRSRSRDRSDRSDRDHDRRRARLS